MLELVPCPACRRHVAVDERGCPFCGAAIRAARAQRFVPRALTRAAVFSAALVACESGSSTTAPASAPVQQQGSAADDELEKMLDTDQRVVDHPVQTPPPPQVVDAGVPIDAAVVDSTPKRTKVRTQKRKTTQDTTQDTKLDDLVRDRQIEERHLAKPYGAPPARRRIV